MSLSILPPEMRGVMSITGYRGVGKSYLASQADAPDNIAFFDFEEKARGIHNQLHFGLYQALTRKALGGPSQLYDVSIEAFENLEQGRYTVAVLDNVSELELALQAGARRNARQHAEEYSLNLKNMLAGRFGGFRPIVNHFISSRVCAVLHSKGVQLVIAIAHVGKQWATGGPIPNKYRIKGADKWQELSILTLALIPGKYKPIPAALVRKEQLGLISWDAEKQEHTIIRRLPLRIPKCTFAEIRRYLDEPANLIVPAEGEIPARAEVEPFSEQLDKEQIAIMRLALEKEQRESTGESTPVVTDSNVAKARELQKKGNLSASQVSAIMIKDNPNATIPVVAGWLANA